MISALQIRKLTHWFHILDVDKKGAINIDDLVAVLYKQAELNNMQKYGDEFEQRRGMIALLWMDLGRYIDINRDGNISLSEWTKSLAMLEKYTSWEGFALDHPRLRNGLVGLLGVTDNKEADIEAYTRFLRAYSADQGIDIPAVFNKLDINGNGRISAGELNQLAGEFLFSSDTNSPGNWLLGPF